MTSKTLAITALRKLSVNVNWEGLLPIQGEIIVVEDDPTLQMLMVDIVSEIGANARQFD